MRITQGEYEGFRDSIEDLISNPRNGFSFPVMVYWKDYELLYRERINCIHLKLKTMIMVKEMFHFSNREVI